MKEQDPGWKNAVKAIIDRVEKEGYGFTITHEDLLKLFDMKEPVDKITYQEAQEFNLKKMNYIWNLAETLRSEHRLKLFNNKGHGYEVLSPNDQITRGTKKNFKKILKDTKETEKDLKLIRSELTLEIKNLQESYIKKITFLKSYVNQKCLGKVKVKNKGDI